MLKNCLDYRVEIVEDAFGESPVVAEVLKEVTGAEEPRVLLVADQNVVQRTQGLGTRIGRYVQAHGIRLACNPIVVPGGEKIKADNMQTAYRVMTAMLDAKLGAGDCVVALGGGALLDVAGYAAAQVRGGIPIVRLPTTPAAMIDAAYAEYAAVDSVSVKDALRVRSMPAAVVIDPAFAQTVLDGVWRSGIGEAVRIAAVQDGTLMKKLPELAERYRERDPAALAEIVADALAVRRKKGTTSFAEWSAMRLEAMSGYKLPHGYAVSIGVAIDVAYAVAKDVLKEKDRDVIMGVLDACNALDGLNHSRHLLSQPENVLCGLDAWRLATGNMEVTLPAGLGKAKTDPEPDRTAYATILKGMSSAPAPAPTEQTAAQ